MWLFYAKHRVNENSSEPISHRIKANPCVWKLLAPRHTIQTLILFCNEAAEKNDRVNFFVPKTMNFCDRGRRFLGSRGFRWPGRLNCLLEAKQGSEDAQDRETTFIKRGELKYNC